LSGFFFPIGLCGLCGVESIRFSAASRRARFLAHCRTHPLASALKRLLKEQPTLDDVTKAMEELNTDGPRGTVVLAGTLIDDLLRGAILYHMRPLKVEEHDSLFLSIGPLSGFSARIRIAYAFGIVGPSVRDDLDRLRELRNAFAHARTHNHLRYARSARGNSQIPRCRARQPAARHPAIIYLGGQGSFGSSRSQDASRTAGIGRRDQELEVTPLYEAEGQQYGESLYTPQTTRGGQMRRNRLRDAIVAKVKSVLDKGQ
jgi:hypothetical protein